MKGSGNTPKAAPGDWIEDVKHINHKVRSVQAATYWTLCQGSFAHDSVIAVIDERTLKERVSAQYHCTHCTMQDNVNNYAAPGTKSAIGRQEGGDHYTTQQVQPWHIWLDNPDMDPFTANAIKYLMRWRKKNGIEDIKKAKHYVEMLLEQVEKGWSVNDKS